MAKGWLIAWCCAAGVLFTGSGYAYGYYVCYQSRNTIGSLKYFGCTVQNVRCNDSQLYHFGKYTSSQHQNIAYQRCINSEPAPPRDHGLFVCYRNDAPSSKLQRLKYHDCEYSYKPCWQRDLKRFGKYETTRASELALVRCKSGTPLQVD
ncbi:MAG: hypothetical protein P1U34_09155 [Coxiellaceae bacterium]|nr:hypothetical protein [Coxiellaceae bacterium]